MKEVAHQLVAAAGLLAVALVPWPCRAASLDCGKAASSIEKTVCADPELLKMDAALNAKYDDAMKRLSAPGQQVLREGQRNWLRYLAADCAIGESDAGRHFCVNQKYIWRLNELSSAAQKIGPYVFDRSDEYGVVFGSSTDGGAFGNHYGTPGIDNPVNMQTGNWSGLMAAEVQKLKGMGSGWCDGANADADVDFKIDHASAMVISATIGSTMYCHGTPHPQVMLKSINEVMLPKVHALQADDLFANDSQWQGVLTDRFNVLLLAKVGPNNLANVPERAVVQRFVCNPAAWSLGHDGLTIVSAGGELLAYGSGELELTIPWRDLQDVLSSDGKRLAQSLDN